jgi:sulfite reductase (NADPH) flavoprotein alpha-component
MPLSGLAGTAFVIHTDPLRWLGALLLVSCYFALCIATLQARRRVLAATGAASTSQDAVDWLVVFASQTGNGEALAAQTCATLHSGGLSVRSTCMSALEAHHLQATERALFIVSTYGEGDPPDAAARFIRLAMATSAKLEHLHFGLMALGDSTYRNYCGFGASLDQWLRASGAQALFPRVDVDRLDGKSIADWQHHLSHLAGTTDAPDWSAPAYGAWRIKARRLCNPGSLGAPVFDLELVPSDGTLPMWQAGDLVQVSAPSDPDMPREYSIASVSTEGHVRLLVRLHRRDDGRAGHCSGWLCEGASERDLIAMRLREHSRFRLGPNGPRPLILIGNGTGMAGLRAHLKARIDAGIGENWLVFGERSAHCDFHYRDDITAWQESGRLAELSLAFSRDQGSARYVQHRLLEQSTRLRAWVGRGAAIYVCGSLEGMATGVHEALLAALGQQQLDQLSSEGRYRRDVY